MMWRDNSGKDPDAGKGWGQEEKAATEDEMVGWHHQLYAHECEQTLGDGEGQGSLCAAAHGGSRVGGYSVTKQKKDIKTTKNG